MAKDDYLCIKEIEKTVHVCLSPAFISREVSGVIEVLETWKRQYIQQLSGVVVSFKNVSLASGFGNIITDQPFIHYDVKATFSIFKPCVGNILLGKINRISKQHVGCVVHDVINVSIYLSPDTADNVSKFVVLDNIIYFKVTNVDFHRRIIRVSGEISNDCIELMEKYCTVDDEVLNIMTDEESLPETVVFGSQLKFSSPGENDTFNVSEYEDSENVSKKVSKKRKKNSDVTEIKNIESNVDSHIVNSGNTITDMTTSDSESTKDSFNDSISNTVSKHMKHKIKNKQNVLKLDIIKKISKKASNKHKKDCSRSFDTEIVDIENDIDSDSVSTIPATDLTPSEPENREDDLHDSISNTVSKHKKHKIKNKHNVLKLDAIEKISKKASKKHKKDCSRSFDTEIVDIENDIDSDSVSTIPATDFTPSEPENREDDLQKSISNTVSNHKKHTTKLVNSLDGVNENNDYSQIKSMHSQNISKIKKLKNNKNIEITTSETEGSQEGYQDFYNNISKAVSDYKKESISSFNAMPFIKNAENSEIISMHSQNAPTIKTKKKKSNIKEPVTSESEGNTEDSLKGILESTRKHKKHKKKVNNSSDNLTSVENNESSQLLNIHGQNVSITGDMEKKNNFNDSISNNLNLLDIKEKTDSSDDVKKKVSKKHKKKHKLDSKSKKSHKKEVEHKKSAKIGKSKKSLLKSEGNKKSHKKKKEGSSSKTNNSSKGKKRKNEDIDSHQKSKKQKLGSNNDSSDKKKRKKSKSKG